MGPPACEGARIHNRSGPRSLRMHSSQSHGSLLGLKGLPLADSQKWKNTLPLLLPHTQWYCVDYDSRQLSLCWSEHHFQMLRFWEKPQERKLCYYKGSAFVKARKGTRQQSKLSPRSCDPSRPGISSPPEIAFPLRFGQSLRGKQGKIPALEGQPGEDATIKHWSWVQAMIASHLLEAPYPLWSVPQQLTLRFLLDFGKPFSAGGSALLPCGKLAAWFAPALMASGSSGKRSGILDKRAKSMLTHSDFTSSLSFRGDRSSFLPKGTRV